VIAGKGKPFMHVAKALEVSQRYAIYREGEPYIVTMRGKNKI
jgi:hypothetical protein